MKTFAYFDNAATTFPKPECVYEYADKVARNYGVNTGRGDYGLANTAGEIVSESKKLLRKLLGCEGKQVVYTSSATDALNRILQGLTLKKGSAVYISPFEHNAVTRVLHHIASTVGIIVKTLPFDNKTLLLDVDRMLADYEEVTPAAVVVTHASNVCGAVLPVERIAELSKRYGAIVVVDMSQTAGLLPLPLNLETIDFAVFAGHKTLYAPFGIGGFICNPEEGRLKPVLFGGNGINSIEQEMPNDIVNMEEIGSQNIYAIAGLAAATRWLLEQGSQILARETYAKEKLLGILRSFPNVSVVADRMKCDRVGVVSCLFEGYSPDEIGAVLDERGVSVRAGLHCAPYAHRFLGTLPSGTVRFSVGSMSHERDFEVLSDAVQFIYRNT